MKIALLVLCMLQGSISMAAAMGDSCKGTGTILENRITFQLGTSDYGWSGLELSVDQKKGILKDQCGVSTKSVRTRNVMTLSCKGQDANTGAKMKTSVRLVFKGKDIASIKAQSQSKIDGVWVNSAKYECADIKMTYWDLRGLGAD